MAGKYYQNREDRRHEARGMKRYEEKHGNRSKDEHDKDHQYNHHRQTMEDRYDESMGMKEHYQEYADGKYKKSLDSSYMGMIHEDHEAPSNLPQHPIHKKYPPYSYTDKYELDDTIHGIDENLDNSIRKVEDYPSRSMY